MNTINQETSSKVNVLIADDDAPTRILLRAAISRWNYEIVEVSDGEEAWEILQKPDSPRLLILDWLMPKLDGVSLCKRIKSSSENKPYTFIILLTQLTGTTNTALGIEAGADEFLSKPFNMIELQSRLAVGTHIVMNENRIQNYMTVIQETHHQLNQMHAQIREYLSHSDLSTNEYRIMLEKFESDLKQLAEKSDLLKVAEKATDDAYPG